MILSSYERLRRYIGDDSDIGGYSDSAINKRLLLTWLGSVSDRVEQHIKRSLESVSRTVYFDIGYAQKEFWVLGVPVASITSIKTDADGMFTGDESTLDNSEYHIGTEGNSVVLLSNAFRTSSIVNRGVQVAYTGGLAVNAVRSIFVVPSTTDWVVGQFCIGSSSDAVGIVKTVTGTTGLTIEVLYGIFEVAETIGAYTNEDDETAVAGTSTTITSKSQTALCESYPAIVGAVEGEIRYMWKHKLDFEDNSSQRDGETIRRPSDSRAKLQLETRLLLEPYINATL